MKLPEKNFHVYLCSRSMGENDCRDTNVNDLSGPNDTATYEQKGNEVLLVKISAFIDNACKIKQVCLPLKLT